MQIEPPGAGPEGLCAGPGQGFAEWEWGREGWERGCGRDHQIFDPSWTLGASAGPRPLTVATRYCRVPQSRTARLKRISRYYKEKPRVRGHLESPHSGTRGFWVGPSPALLASARPPEDNSTLLPTGERGAEGSRQASFPIYLHTLVHTRHPRACA